MATLKLDTPVQYVKGVGPVRAEQLAELGIHTVEDLLTHFPRRFDLRRQTQPMSTLRGEEPAATVAGVVQQVEYKSFGRKPYFACTLQDETGWVLVKWFHGGYLRDRIREGMTLAVTGRVGLYREAVQFINPSFQIVYDSAGAKLDQDELLPVYPASGVLSSGVIGGIIKAVLPQADGLIACWFDAEYLKQRDFPERFWAVAAMHRPEDSAAWKRARRRLAYDELLLMQMGLAIQRSRTVSQMAYALPVTPEIDVRIRARFPFTMTSAQDKALAEIVRDLARPVVMNRLLQGDVGSGKTVVALYAALLAVAHGKQAAIMAPTEILARQHFAKTQQYLEGSRVRTALLVGSQRPEERAGVLAGLESGDIDVVVGTHALITPRVSFKSLALIVVDEQHKFGVMQRSNFRAKGHAPHCLVMTATPIPRTLALTVFGDLDFSSIDQLPPGRGKTVTRLVGQTQMANLLEFVRKRLAAGQQAYFVYPLVSESAKSDLTAAQEASAQLARTFADFAVGLIHGQMPTARQQAVMRQFAGNEVQVLVASTVVEVGLDVPNANIMVVMHAERFGLAQLHQLRGRVGRGREDAVCILVSGAKSPLAHERLEALVATGDGFKIAEADLRIRGPGQFFGTRQHGLPELKVADLIDDYELMRMARRDAFDIIAQDPDLSAPGHQALRAALLKSYGQRLGLITAG